MSEMAISPVTRTLRIRVRDPLVPPRDSSFRTSVIGVFGTERPGPSPNRIVVRMVIAATNASTGKLMPNVGQIRHALKLCLGNRSHQKPDSQRGTKKSDNRSHHDQQQTLDEQLQDKMKLARP